MSFVKKTVKTALIGLQLSIVYKNDFILGFLSGIIGLMIQLVFWPVFFYAGAEFRYSTVENVNIAGYYINEMMTYSTLIYFIQRVTSMMNISRTIKEDITSGNINIYLIRPIKYLWAKWIISISENLINFVLSLLLFLVSSAYLKNFFVFINDFMKIFLVTLFILFACILSFLINCIMGILSFWLLEIGALNNFVKMGISILSGSLFPIDFIKGNIGIALEYLPFSYLGFYPIQIYLGKTNTANIVQNIYVCLLWIIFLVFVANKIWKSGLRRYSAFGG